MAIIYEVNLKVAHSIAQSYLNWLRPHIREMLGFAGFIDAALYQEKLDMETSKEYSYVVQYRVATMADLENYFKNHAPRMREEGLNLFKDQFSATRRIMMTLDFNDAK
jgi:hypothetical protein